MEKLNVPDNSPEQLEVDHELAHRLIGGRAVEMYSVPIDPMDELQCESCQ